MRRAPSVFNTNVFADETFRETVALIGLLFCS